MLGMKRAIRWAAENGFDQVAWAPGEVQAERYNLSKQVDTITIARMGDNKYDLVAVKWDRPGIGSNLINESGITLDRIEALIGKEFAEKAKNQENNYTEYSGDDLKVGGEGMKGFYDQILPKAVDKFIKKFGAKVGTSMVWTDKGSGKIVFDGKDATRPADGTDVWSFPITDKMRESAMAGLPLFSSFSRTVTNLNPNLDAAVMEEQIQKIDEITATVRQMLGATLSEQITLKTPDYMIGEKGMPVAGSFDPITAVMRVALNAVEPVSVAAHEGFHAAQYYLMTRSERAITRNAFKAGKPLRAKLESQMELAGDRAAVQQMDSPMEAEAYGYQYWKDGKLRTNGPVETIFRKIAQFFERVKNLLQGNGFQSWEDVFDALYLGQLANRNAKLGPQYKYNALHVSAVEKEQGAAPGSKLFSESDTQDSAASDHEVFVDAVSDASYDVRTELGLHHFKMNRKEFSDKMHKAWVRTVGSMQTIARTSPTARRVFELVQDMIGYKSTIISDVDADLTDFLNESAEVRYKIGKVMLTGTVKNKRYDTSNPKDLNALKNDHKLTDREIDVYAKVRASLDKLVDIWTAARIDSAEKAGVLTDKMKKGFTDTADWMKAAGYVPLRRYGKLILSVYDKNLGRDKGQIYYAHFESEAERNRAAENIQEVLKSVRNKMTVEMAEESDINVEFNTKQGNIGVETSASQFQQFMQRLDELNIEVDDETRNKFINYIIDSEQAMLRNIQRKGTPGYAKDIVRILADYAVTTANSAASMAYNPDINRVMALEDWKNEGPLGGFHQEQMADLVRFVRSGDVFNDTSNEVVGRLRAFAAMSMLGGNISTGAINLTQLALATVPYITKYTGASRAYGSVLGAMRDVINPVKFGSANSTSNERLKKASEAGKGFEGLTPDETQMMWRATEQGVVQAQQIFAISGMAQGRLMARSGKIRRAADLWMTPFVFAEEVNRRTTFLSAYRVGKQIMDAGEQLTDMAGNPFLDPGTGQEITDKEAVLYEFSKRAVEDTQFVYNRANRPAWARSGLGEALFTFKTFPIFMWELCRYMQKSGNTQGAVVMLSTIMLASGASGLFFMDDLADIIDTIGQRLGVGSSNIRLASTKLIHDMANDIDAAWLGDAVINGLLDTALDKAGLGISVGGRLGMGNIAPGTGVALEGEDFWSGTVKDIAGPIGSVLEGSAKALGSVTDMDAAGIMRNFPATGIKNAYKAIVDYENGVARDARGYKIADVSSTSRWVGKALGFTPYAVTREYDKMKLAKKQTSFMAAVRRDIMTDLVRSLNDSDKSAYNEIMQGVVEWNRAHPDPQWFIKLRKEDVLKAYKKSQQTVTERMYETTPKDQRAGYKFLLH